MEWTIKGFTEYPDNEVKKILPKAHSNTISEPWRNERRKRKIREKQ